MYSVEDLLISHGYKLPKNAPSPCETARYADCQREMAEKGSGHGTANGYETDAGAYVCGKQPLAKGYSDDNECKDRNQRRKAGSGNQGDTQPLGDFSTRDSGLYDGPRGVQAQPRGERDVSYWRRRGQDFSVLLDYGDCRELRGSGFTRPTEGAWISLGEERGRERQPWDEVEREAGRDQWRATGDRKCQSLGMEEWRPAVPSGRQLSGSEGERWAQGQWRITASDGGVDPRTKGKSLSLPRVLLPESLQYVDVSTQGQSAYGVQRLNGSFSHRPPHKHYGRDWWTENEHWPGGQGALLPKPRFSRPLKPPSYEAHQQTRGSSEMLAGDQVPHPKDKGSCAPRQDSLAPEPVGPSMEPPVYIPPPSYERPLLHGGAQKNYGDVSDFRLKGAPFQQVPGRWFSRSTGGSWLEQPRDRSTPCRKQVHPGLSPNNLGWVQYLPFDDPRVRHISGGPCGNAQTDTDKIRHINKELPSANVLEQSTHDSAFPPTQGLYVSAETDKRSLNEHNNGNRWYSGLHKESGNSIASNQSCNEYQKDQSPTVQERSSEQSTNVDKVFPETVTQVKKIEPGMEGERKQSSKRRLNETIFCLVSVPVHLQPNEESCDQNNNEKPDQSNTDQESTAQSGEDLHSQMSKSLTDLELQTLTEHRTRDKGPKRPLPGKESQPLHLNNHKELLYSGSWPGDQYRDQETQTSCPAAPKGAPQGLLHQQAQVQGPSATDAIADNGVGGDCSAFGYPMKGQKSLNPSSNSAFSRTANFPSKLRNPKEQSPVPSDSKEEAGCPLARRSEAKSLPGNGQEAFGQFLLKPVSRRPWDAIEELESFNKELQLQISKRPSMDQCIEDLDQAYRDILELSTTSDNRENCKAQIPDCNPVKEEPPRKPNKIQHAFDTWSTTGDPEHGKVRSAFSRPPAKTVSFQKLPNEPGFRDYGLLSQIPPNVTGDCIVPRQPTQDIPVLRESLLRDVGLTVYTEMPGEPRQPTQDVSTLTSPPDYEDVYQTLLLSRDRAAAAEYNARSMDVTPQSSFRTFGLEADPVRQEPSLSGAETDRKVKKKNLMCGYMRENIPEVKGQGDEIYYQREQPDFARSKPAADRRTNGEVASVLDEEDSDHFNWQKQLSLAEKHLEELLINEKANSLPKEDLSNLYEVQCAEGIPEKESIEERAARILGIEVPAESLAVVDPKPAGDTVEPVVAKKPEPMMTQEPWESSVNGKSLQVQSQYEEVIWEPVDPNGSGWEEEETAGPGEGSRLSGTLERLLLSVAVSNSDDKLSLTASGDMQGYSAFPEPEVMEAEALEAEVMEAAAIEAEVMEAAALEAEVIKAAAVETEALEAQVMEAAALEAEVMEAAALEARVIEAVALEAEALEAEVMEAAALEFETLEAGALQDGTFNLFGQEAMENIVIQSMERVSVAHMEDLTIRSIDSGEESKDEEEWNMEDRGNSTPQLGLNDTLRSAISNQPRNATVAKREITLPLDLSEYSREVEYLDEGEEEVLPFSDSYDPSRVERV